MKCRVPFALFTISSNYGSETGGILSKNGSLTITNSTISGNTTGGGYQRYIEAGGIAVDDSNLTVSNSQITGNSGNHGGISITDSTAIITNSTITGNGGGQGGGIYGRSGPSANGLAWGDSNITIAGSSTIAGNASGDIYSDGTVIFGQTGNPLVLSGDTILSSGNYEIAAGTTAQLNGALTLDTTLSVDSGATLQVNSGGALNVESYGELVLDNSSTLTLATDSTLDDMGTVVISSATVDVNGGAFNLDSGGQFNLSAGGLLQINSGGLYDTGTLTLSGATVIVDGGSLDLGTQLDAGNGSLLQINSGGTLNIGGELTVGSASTLTIASGSSVDDSGSLVLNSGASAVDKGTFSANGPIQIDAGANLHITTGTITITATGYIQNDGTLNLDGGNLVYAGWSYYDTGVVNITDGTCEVASGFTFSTNGPVNVNSGGVVHVDNGATLSLADETTINAGGSIIVDGIFEQSDGSLVVNPTAVLSIASGGQLNLSTTGYSAVTAGGSVDDEGTFTLGAGTLGVDGGIFNVQDGGLLSISSATLLFTDSGSLIEDSTGDVEIGGTLDLASASTFASSGGIVNITSGGMNADASTLTLNCSLYIASGAGLSLTDGSVLDMTGGALSNYGSILVDASTGTIAGGSATLHSASTLHVSDGGQLTFHGCDLSEAGTVTIDSGANVWMDAGLYLGDLMVGAGGVLTITDGGSLSSETLIIGPGGTLLNTDTSTLDLTAALNSGELVLDAGSSLINLGTLVISANLTLGTINLQNLGTLNLGSDDTITGGGTYTPPTTTLYSYRVDGGIVSGTTTQSESFTWTYTYTATSETYAETDSGSSSYNGSGNYSYFADGGPISGSVTEGGSSNFSDGMTTTATLGSGGWVYSGSDTSTSSDHGTWSYSDTGGYFYFVNGGGVSGTDTEGSGEIWNDSQSVSTTQNADGTWLLVSGGGTSSGNTWQDSSYTGGGGYVTHQNGGSYNGTLAENGTNNTTGTDHITSNVSSGAWVNTGTSSGTWLDAGGWTDTGNGTYQINIPGGDISGTTNGDKGENWNSSGSSASTLATNGSWTLASGSGTDTDNTHDNPSENGSGGYDSFDSAGFYGGTISTADAMTNSAHTTINSSVVTGAWVNTSGGSTTASSDAGHWTVTETGDYFNFNYGLNIPMSGTTHDAAQETWSSGFSTTSTLNSSTGTWTKTGSGHTHDSAYDDFNYGGNGSATLQSNGSYPSSIGTVVWHGTSNSTLTEGGLYDQSVDTTTDNWILDPSGIWRAANTTIISTGDAQSNFTYNCNGSGNTVTLLEGGNSSDTITSSGSQHEESDYNYRDTLNLATDINGIVTKSGTGSGAGTASGSLALHGHDVQISVNNIGSYYMNDNAGQESYNFVGGNWTENYATGVVDPGTPLNTISGTTITVWRFGSDGPLQGPGAVPYSSTQNYPGFLGGYGIVSPSLSYRTDETPDFGKMLPSAPLVKWSSVVVRKPPAPYINRGEITPPPWESKVVWMCRGIFIACTLGAGVIEALGADVVLGGGAEAAAAESAAVDASMTADQQALKELVDAATNGGRTPLSPEDFDTVADWAKELNYPGFRASLYDLFGADLVPVLHTFISLASILLTYRFEGSNMWFLIVAKPGSVVGPLREGGRSFVLPPTYSGVDRFSLPIASQLALSKFPHRFLLPRPGIGLKVLPSIVEAQEAVGFLEREGGTRVLDVEGRVGFCKERGMEVYKSDNVEIIAIRGEDLETRYRHGRNPSGCVPSVRWLGFDLYAEGEWSLLRATLDAGRSQELLSFPGFISELGLFGSRVSALAYTKRYAELTALGVVEPIASDNDATCSLGVLAVEVGRPEGNGKGDITH